MKRTENLRDDFAELRWVGVHNHGPQYRAFDLAGVHGGEIVRGSNERKRRCSIRTRPLPIRASILQVHLRAAMQ
jgi:hypothetical protein